MTYAELNAALMKLYHEGAFAEGLELATRERPNHSAEVVALDYFRLCFAGRLGEKAVAKEILTETLNRGDWFPADFMQQDEDLASLRELPEFQQVLPVFAERMAAAIAEPFRLTVAPEGATGVAPLLMAMHGNFHAANDEVQHWAPLSRSGWQVAMIQSTQPLFPGRFVWNDRERGVQTVKHHYAELVAEGAVNESKLVLGGFSMGGGLCIWLAVTGELPARGFIAMGPWMADPSELKPFAEAAKARGLRGYIIVGEKDQGCLQASQAMQKVLAEHGVPCGLEILPDLIHVYPEPFDPYLERAMRFLFPE